MKKKKPLIIGVAGGSGSGKTTIIKSIIEDIGRENVVILEHDSYYKNNNHLPLLERERINYDHPNSLETELLVKNIEELSNKESVEVPIYDFKTHRRSDKGKIIKSSDVIIIDGILVLAEKKLREIMDVKIFVSTDSDIRFIRRLKRDITERNRSMDSVVNQYLTTVRPMHNEFVEPSRRYADIIIPVGRNPVSTHMVVATIRDRLGQNKR